MKKDTIQNRRSFVVIEPDPVIALDLEGILTSRFPDSELTVFSDPAKAEQYLTTATSAVYVVLNSTIASAALMTVLRECVARKGEVLFIGSIGKLEFPAATIQVPFTSEMVLSVLS